MMELSCRGSRVDSLARCAPFDVHTDEVISLGSEEDTFPMLTLTVRISR